MRPLLTLYARPGCHLCELAEQTLAELAANFEFELEVVDIEQDDALHRRWLERIPVLAWRETVLAELDGIGYDVLAPRLAALCAARGTL